MKQVIIILGFSSRWQDWILFKRDHNPFGFSSWHQEMDKYFTTENRHAKHNSGSTALARDKFWFWVYTMQHEVCRNDCDLCNRGRLQISSTPVSTGKRSEQTYPVSLMKLHGPTTPLQFLQDHQKDTDKKFYLETESLVKLADCDQTANMSNLFLL